MQFHVLLLVRASLPQLQFPLCKNHFRREAILQLPGPICGEDDSNLKEPHRHDSGRTILTGRSRESRNGQENGNDPIIEGILPGLPFVYSLLRLATSQHHH